MPELFVPASVKRSRLALQRTVVIAAVFAMICSLSIFAFPGEAAAQLYDAPAIRYQTNARGDIDFIANTLLTCPASADCTVTQTAGNNQANNNYAMVYVDSDTDATTFNSSSSDLNLPAGANVLFAGLYWGARSDNPARNQVKLDTPAAGGYTTLTATTLDDDAAAGGLNYQGFIDITSTVQADGNGTYFVADVQAETGGGRHAGWSMYVVYEDPSLPFRNLTVYDGFARVNQSNPVSITVSGFLTPVLGPVTAKVTQTVYEGDELYDGDQMLFEGTVLSDAVHPADNFFNSRISKDGALFSDKNPDYIDQLGFDVARVDVTGLLGNSQTSAQIDYSSQGDWYYVGVVASAIDIFVPDLETELEKSFIDLNGGVLKVGDTVEYVITTENVGLDPAVNTLLVDAIPAGTTYVANSLEIVDHPDPLLDGTTPDDSMANIATDGGGFDGTAAQFELGTIDPAAGFEVRFQVTIDADTETDLITNNADLTYDSATTGDSFENDGQVDFTVVAVAELEFVSKVDSVDPVVAGSAFTYTINVVNNGPSNAVNPVIVDTLPAGLSFVSGAGCTAAGQVVTCTLSSPLANGASDSATITVLVDAAQPAGVVTNEAQVSSDTLDEDLTNNDGDETTEIVRNADLGIVKTADPSPVTAGSPLTYTLTITNDGDSTAINTVVSDSLPAGVTLVSATPDNASTCTGTTNLTCALGTLDPAEVVVITIVVNTDPALVDESILTNEAGVESDTPDDNSANDTSVAETPVEASARLLIRKTGPVTATAGGTITYSITVQNAGPSVASNTTITDALPPPLTFASSPDCTLTTPPNGVTCALGTLAPSTNATVTIVANVPSSATPGTITNTAEVTADEDPDGASDDHDTEIEREVDLGIVKTDDVDPILAGETVTYTFVVTNDGPSDAAGVTVTDPVPALMTFNSVGSTAGCALAAGVVTCPAGTVTAGGSATVQIAFVVDGTAPDGTITNTATVTSNEDPVGASDSEDTTVVSQAPSLTLLKATATTQITAANQTVPFTFLVTNTGNVPLNPISVADPLIPVISCPVSSLAVGASTTCTGDYTTTQADMDNGGFTNTATGTGESPTGVEVDDTSSVTTPALQNPSIDMVKSANVSSVNQAGDTILYSFEVTNDGNVTIDNVAISDPMVGAVTCPVTTLAPGASTTCTADAPYVVTQADFDGEEIPNSATATGDDPNGDETDATDNEVVSANFDPSMTLDKATTTTSVDVSGQIVPFTFLVTNDGNVTMTGLTITDPLIATVTCPVTTLAPGASTTCTGSYTVTQADVDAGGFTNTAEAEAFAPNGDSDKPVDSVTTPGDQDASIAVVKSADVTEVNEAGDPVNFSFEVTNDGNVTLVNVAISDPLVGAVTCPVTTLAPGASTTCTADAAYLASQADIDAGGFTNTATAAGDDPNGDETDATDSETTPAPADASIAVVKSADVTEVNEAGDPVNFSFEVTNDGNVTMTSIAISDPLVGAVTCPVTTLAPGASTTCTADAAYLASQADIDAGGFTNTATATADDPNGDETEDTDSVTTPAPTGGSITVAKSADVTEVNEVGDPVNFSFLVTNDGNVTMTNVAIDDPLVGAVTCPVTTLAPDASTTCTADAAYLATQADIDAGGFTNTATATGDDPNGDETETTDSVTTPAPADPSITVAKSGDVTEVNEAGDPVNFSFEVTNDGNVTMSNITVNDPLVGAVTCLVATLAPGTSTTCTADAAYAATQADIDAGGFTNTAGVLAEDPNGDEAGDADSVTTPAPAAPSVNLVKASTTTALTEAGQIVPFTFTVTNDGNVTVTNLAIADPLIGAITCPATTLAPDASTICTGDYVVTQADVDAGSFLNTAKATADDPNGDETEDTDSVTTPSTPDALLTIDKLDPTGILEVDETISYQFVVANEGNVTLSAISVEDPTANPVTCPLTVLAPSESMICDAEYVVTQADVDAGVIINTATASGQDPSGTPVGGDDTVETAIAQNPSIEVTKASATTEITTANQLVPFTFTVMNTGDVNLTAISVDDPLTGPVVCPLTALAPGASMICNADYLTTQADVDNGSFSNTAIVTSTNPTGEETTDDDTVITPSPQGPALLVDKLAPVGVLEVGQTLIYDFVVTNIGNVTITGITVDDPLANPVSCPLDILLPAGSMTCSAGYIVTQADVDAGGITNVANATGFDPNGEEVTDDDTVETPIEQNPSVNLIKAATETLDAVGQSLPYTFTVTNDGNVTVTGLAISDPLIGAVTCPVTTLLPGETTVCTGAYVVTQLDIDAGQIVNTATATAQDPSGDDTSDTDTETSFGEQSPSMVIDKLSPVGILAVGETITYFFEAANTGNVTLTGLVVNDTTTGPVTCNTTTLAPEDTTLCQAEYLVTQADVDAGAIVNVADAAAQPPSGDPVTSQDTETTEVAQVPSIDVAKQAPAGALAVDQTITYTFLVTNTGNVTLTNVGVIDPLIPVVSCDLTSLLPGAVATCSGSYLVTQADVDAGVVRNSATATGAPPIGDPVSDGDTETTSVDQNPSLLLDKIAPVEVPELGVSLTYTFVVTNTGDVTLTNLVINDPLAGVVTCDVTTLAPSEFATCQADYVVTQFDVDAGTIRNDATATAADPLGGPVEGIDGIDTPVSQLAALELTKDSSATELVLDETINFTFEATNTGTVTLTDLTIADALVPVITCPVTTLLPSESTTCSGDYVVTQTDVDLAVLVNTASASANDPTGTPISGEDTEEIEGSSDPSVDVDKSASEGPFVLGSEILYTFLVTNTGNQTVTGITLVDAAAPPVCPSDTLVPGEQMTCTAIYSVTQSDVDAGGVVNVVEVVGVDPVGEAVGDTDTEVTSIDQIEAIEFDKLTPTGTLAVGETITYSFAVSNVGTVTLTDVTVSDPLLPAVVCVETTLAPAQTTTCAGDYVVTQADVDAGVIVNTASVVGDTPSGSADGTDTETTVLPQLGELTLVKTGPSVPLALGSSATYTFEITNSGTVTMGDIALSDPLVDPVTCPETTLVPGQSMTCAASYVVTQVDVDTGQIFNSATISGSTPDGTAIVGGDEVTTTIPQAPALNLDKDAPIGELVAGAEVTYIFTVTNIGDVTLFDVIVGDPLIAPIVCEAASLAPGVSTTCSSVYVISQADVDNGEVINVAAATASDPTGTPMTDVDSETTEFAPEGELALDKQAPQGPFLVGEQLTWTFTATNNGNVTLSNLTITDTKTGPVTCDLTTLAPGQAVVCTATSTLSQADIDAGEIVNNAQAGAVDPSGTELDAEDTATAVIPAVGRLDVAKSTVVEEAELGQLVPFVITITNTGNVTLTNIVASDTYTPVNCPGDTLGTGESMDCTATMEMTQDMINAGSVTNAVSVSGQTPDGDIATGNDTEIVQAFVPPVPVASISINKLAPTEALVEGATVEYSFVVRNDGDLPLTGITVDDPLAGPVNCPATELEVDASFTCTASYIVTEGDVATGTVTNSASVTALDPDGDSTADEDEIVTAVVQPTPTPTPTPLPTPRPVPLVLNLPTFSPPAPTPTPLPAPQARVEEPSEPLAHTGGSSAAAVASAMTLMLTGGALVIFKRRRVDRR